MALREALSWQSAGNQLAISWKSEAISAAQRHSGRPFRSTQWHSVVPGDGLLLISSGDGMGEQSRPLVAPVAPLSPTECTHRWSCRERSSERRRERSPT